MIQPFIHIRFAIKAHLHLTVQAEIGQDPAELVAVMADEVDLAEVDVDAAELVAVLETEVDQGEVGEDPADLVAVLEL